MVSLIANSRTQVRALSKNRSRGSTHVEVFHHAGNAVYIPRQELPYRLGSEICKATIPSKNARYKGRLFQHMRDYP